MPRNSISEHNFIVRQPCQDSANATNSFQGVISSNKCSSPQNLLIPTMTNTSPTEHNANEVSSAEMQADLTVRLKSCSTDSSIDESADVFVVQPSFDDHGALGLSKSHSSLGKYVESQSRHPDEDKINDDIERRNPSSPGDRHVGKQERRGSHTRNLSALFDATSISDEIFGTKQPLIINPDLDTRKHRRMFSGDASNPNVAHRRLNSGGNAAQISRRTHHQRQASEGLDILWDVANATREALSPKHEQGPSARSSQSSELTKTYPRRYQGQVPSSSSSSLTGSHQNYDAPFPRNQMDPPPHRLLTQYSQQNYAHSHPSNPYTAYHRHHPHHGIPYYSQYYGDGLVHSYHPAEIAHRQDYYQQKNYDYNSRPPIPQEDKFERGSSSLPDELYRVQAATDPPSQGTAAYVTALTEETKEASPPVAKRKIATNADLEQVPVPCEVGHHRTFSSYSSIGTLDDSTVPSTNACKGSDDGDKGKRHHRMTSSSISFLNGLDFGLNDANFLQNLRASNSSAASTFQTSPMKENTKNKITSPPPKLPPPQPLASVDTTNEEVSKTVLASGGTSKRVRRKCTMPGCTNRVVQGGLCISHGAKRKTCGHPGCSKNVKKAGMCSTHGPARKRCEFPDCSKVAVQGGRCIAHGAKKKLCSVEGCSKQAILSGMCKKHHDQSKLGKLNKEMICLPAPSQEKISPKPTHTRGLSIFQEMSADAISSILNGQSDARSKNQAANMASSGWPH